MHDKIIIHNETAYDVDHDTEEAHFYMMIRKRARRSEEVRSLVRLLVSTSSSRVVFCVTSHLDHKNTKMFGISLVSRYNVVSRYVSISQIFRS